jgi:hypothetical protein
MSVAHVIGSRDSPEFVGFYTIPSDITAAQNSGETDY